MSLEEKIIAWSKDRPEWQRDIMRRIAIGDVLSGEDYDKIVQDISHPTMSTNTPLGLEHLPRRGAEALSVRLLSITKTEHVNALASDESLTFEPVGLTIAYLGGTATFVSEANGADKCEMDVCEPVEGSWNTVSMCIDDPGSETGCDAKFSWWHVKHYCVTYSCGME